MTITTHMHPAIAATKADLVYDATDDLGFPVTCFFAVRSEREPADRSVGEPGGWNCIATLIGCQIGSLVLGENDAHNALDGNVRMLERVAAEFEADRRDAEGVAA